MNIRPITRQQADTDLCYVPTYLDTDLFVLADTIVFERLPDGRAYHLYGNDEEISDGIGPIVDSYEYLTGETVSPEGRERLELWWWHLQTARSIGAGVCESGRVFSEPWCRVYRYWYDCVYYLGYRGAIRQAQAGYQYASERGE